MESPNYDFEKLVELVIQVSEHMEAIGVLILNEKLYIH